MAINASHLLKLLEPAVRPGQPSVPQPASRLPLESQSFDQLLALASTGALQSGRQIELAFEPDPPLDAQQLERLAAAADQAEAAGATQALMLIDGRGFMLDVQSRTLMAELSGDPATRVMRIDAAVFVPSIDEELAVSRIAMPGSGLLPAGVLEQLQSALNKDESASVDAPRSAAHRATG